MDYSYVNIGTINIGTLTDKSEEIVYMMTNRNLKILGLAETRYKGTGHLKLHDNYELFYSGSTDDTRHGVGLIIHPDLSCHVEKIYNVNSRIIAVTMNMSNYKLSLIQTYAPQQGRPQEEKDDFYLNLQDTIDNLPADSDYIVMGDLNGHVGSDKVENIVGDFGVGTRNTEGDALIDFCMRNNLSIMNTFFKHQESHQFTWYRYNNIIGSYDQKTQIDFIMTSKKSIIKDVKAVPSESLDSDHRLVKGKLKIHIPEKPKNITRKRVKTENIPDKMQEIQQAIHERAEDIKSDNVEDYWQNMKKQIHDIQENIIGMKTIGKTKKKKTGWWTEEVKAEVNKKNELFKNWLKLRTPESRDAYVNQRKHVYYVKKHAKSNMWKKIGEDLENDLEGTRKLIYGMAKNYKNRNEDKPKNATIKDKDGEAVTGNENVADRWMEYFEDLLNVDADDEIDNTATNINSSRVMENEADNNPITMAELEAAIKLTRNNKSPGADAIPVETLKAGGQPLKTLLLDLMNKAWSSAIVPEEWNESIICPIYKNKGDPLDCKNYRGISLMSHAGKIYERILETRLRAQVEHLLSESQSGFRPGRGTTDQIAALRLLLEKSWEYDINQYICFLDLEKAFDRVPRNKIWNVLYSSGVDTKLLDAIKSTYRNQRSSVLGGKRYFMVKSGVRQGSVLSPLLFIIYMNEVIMQIDREDYTAEHFGYADDVGQTADTIEKLQLIMNKWDQELTRAGLKLNYDKTEVLKVGRVPVDGDIIINGHKLKETNSFVYLGSKLSSDNLIEVEINHRIAKFTKNVNCLYPLLREKAIPKQVKICMYTTILRPVILYGSETWTLTKRLKSKIQAAEMRILRLIYGVTKRDRIKNDIIRDTLKVTSILTVIERNQLRWFGHVLRMNDNRDVKRLYRWNPGLGTRRKRPIGRPRKRWRDEIKEITSRELERFEDAEELTRDRVEWRSMTKRLTTNRREV